MSALNGIRVLELATVIAGPYAGNIFSDFGAEVIKVEMPGLGDAFRTQGPFHQGKNIRWPSLSRNKKSITLDLRQDEGKNILLELIAVSDVIIENFRVGTLDKWGLDIETMRKANPKIIVARVTGYGQTGPKKQLSGFGTPCTAFSGVTYCTGYPDRSPVSPYFSLADYVAGLYTVIGALMSLYNRDIFEGKSQEIDISLYEGLFRMQESLVADYHLNGIIKERQPKMSGSASPSATFKTKDNKWVVIVCSTDKTFEYLTNAMGRHDELMKNYDTALKRINEDDYILSITDDWVSKLNYKELEEICRKEGVPVDLVYSIEDIFEDDHYAARNDIIEFPSEEFGTVKMPNVFPILSETPGEVNWIGPKLGAHNEEVYLGLLNKSKEYLEILREKNIV
ncbi:MAG: CaiB/BaiF CoA-transferase family protein [Eubacteriales bacterium]|nr:CaiB/BaiF CoA-transferase family protein [Eubacteriales bacterium]